MAFAVAQRHSRHVRVLKLVFPFVAAAMAATFFGFSYIATPTDITLAPDTGAISDGKFVMANPKLEGLTKEKREYSMTAQRAIQDMANPASIELETIAAKLPIDVDKWVSIEAPKGLYDRDKNTLDVTSPFKVETTQGWTAELQSAFIDIGSGSLKTDKAVDIRVDGTRVQADSMSVIDKGQLLVFEKRVKMRIEPARLQQIRQANGN